MVYACANSTIFLLSNAVQCVRLYGNPASMRSNLGPNFMPRDANAERLAHREQLRLEAHQVGVSITRAHWGIGQVYGADVRGRCTGEVHRPYHSGT